MSEVIKLKDQTLAVLGDCHTLGPKLHSTLERVEETTIIQLGDLGWGFDSPEVERANVNRIIEICKKNNIELFFIQGNHDCRTPYFSTLRKEGPLTWLPDYSLLERHNGEKLQICGGATSIDRILRIPNRSWWDDEGLIFDKNKVEKNLDILLTHTFDGVEFGFHTNKEPITSWAKRDKMLVSDLQKEHEDIRRILEISQPARTYCGHFHCAEIRYFENRISRIVDIFEILEVK